MRTSTGILDRRCSGLRSPVRLLVPLSRDVPANVPADVLADVLAAVPADVPADVLVDVPTEVFTLRGHPWGRLN